MKKFYLLFVFAVLASMAGMSAAETWVKVTSEPTSWEGDYLIVYDGTKAFDGSLTNLNVTNNFVKVSDVEGKITTENCNFYFSIESQGGDTYSIKSASGYFIGRKTGSNGLDSDKAYSSTLASKISLSGGIVSAAASSVSLQFNKASDQLRFRYFKSKQESVSLYKKEKIPATELTLLLKFRA